MTNNAHAMYALNLDQIANIIKVCGHKRTVLVQGHMGTGKSSLLRTLARELPKHTAFYFDCTTKDLGDIMLPKLKDADGQDYVRFATNEELGVHLRNQPIILMLDEFGKSNPSVKNALLLLMLERKIGSYELHPESIVFATTNLGSEGVGDLLLPHMRNRMTIITARKPGHMEWIEWGINNGIDHSLLGWVKDNPQLFRSFEDVQRPDDNPYIYHPRAQQAAFVTPRSLEAASDWLKQREFMDPQSVTAALIGTIGDRAAMDLMAFVSLADDLPTLESIKKDPENARLPASAAAVCMIVYRTLASIEADWIDSWMTYMFRLDKEAQALFANGVRAPRYHKQGLVMTNRKFTEWAMKNNYLFAADKK
jgi:energy-coupling factor transporter ATP-binding protein EcfA2